jgi:hypothetical protein
VSGVQFPPWPLQWGDNSRDFEPPGAKAMSRDFVAGLAVKEKRKTMGDAGKLRIYHFLLLRFRPTTSKRFK